MRIHSHLVDSICEALKQTFEDGYHADKVLERQFKAHKKWGSRDRKFVAETFYDCVRWWRKLCYSIGIEGDTYQSVTPEQSRDIVASYLVNYKKIELQGYSPEKIRSFASRFNEKMPSRAIAQSVTDWFDQYGSEQWAEDWDEILSSLNQQASLFLRTNTLKVSRDELLNELSKAGFKVEAVEQTPEGIRLIERKNLFVTDLFKKGFFEVQDISSQLVSHMLAPKKSEVIIDACCGAGGKSLHIAALMENKGKLISLDINQRKLDEHKKRRKRSGADIIEIKHIESTKTIKRLEARADGLLLDVPCTGSGVLKRNPDTKWKLNGDEVNRLKSIQQDILQQYSKMVKSGGRMVYATCSIFPEENQEQVARFLESDLGSAWKLESDRVFDPRDGFDGFYASLIVRKS